MPFPPASRQRGRLRVVSPRTRKGWRAREAQAATRPDARQAHGNDEHQDEWQPVLHELANLSEFAAIRPEAGRAADWPEGTACDGLSGVTAAEVIRNQRVEANLRIAPLWAFERPHEFAWPGVQRRRRSLPASHAIGS